MISDNGTPDVGRFIQFELLKPTLFDMLMKLPYSFSSISHPFNYH